MKDNKGFAISGILYAMLIISLLLVVGTLKTLQNRKMIIDKIKSDITDDKTYEALIIKVQAATREYMQDNPSELPSDKKCVLISTLVNSSKITEENSYNPKTSRQLEGGVKVIKNDNNSYQYIYSEDCGKNITVTFDYNGGSGSTQSKTVTYYGNYGDLPTPNARSGYEFVGWNGKNMFDASLATGDNLTISEGVANQTTADTKGSLDWEIQKFNDSTLVESSNPFTHDELGIIPLNFIKSSSFNKILFGLYGSSLDTKVKYYVSNLSNETVYTVSFNVTNVTQGSISWNNIQLEEGSIATDYEPYKIISTTQVVQNKNHILKAIWKEVTN